MDEDNEDDAGNDIYNIRIAEFKPGDKNAPGPKLAFKNLVNADQDGDGVIQMTIPELDILMQDINMTFYIDVKLDLNIFMQNMNITLYIEKRGRDVGHVDLSAQV